MIKYFKIFFFIILWSSCCQSQHEDHIWMYGSAIYDQIQGFVHEDTTWGATNIDFSYSPPKIYYDHNRLIDFRATNSSVSNEYGEILMYSNGQAIWNGENEFIEDTINYNGQWENWTLYQDEILVLEGLPAIQGALILPFPSKDSVYMMVYSQFNLEMLRTMNLFSAQIDLNLPFGNQVVYKDKLLIEADTIASGTLNAVKHSNGRDWWILKLDRNNGNIFKFLLDVDGISDYEILDFGDDFESSIGQLNISPDGKKIAVNSLQQFGVDGGQVIIANFDRSSGYISNIQEGFIDGITYAQGLSFSPNSNYLYVSDGQWLYQYDLKQEDIINSRLAIEEYDGFNYYYTQDSLFPEPQRFGWMGLAPDGKIYVSSQMPTSRVMHRINNPNLKGVACDLEQHSVFLPTSYARTIPNFPNFRLGPLDDSPADTLGLNNHPVAKYRYVQDSLEDLRVHFFDLSYFDPQDYEWNFGDGTTSDELEPNHTYAEKGVYEVCLTVSNIYDTSTSCKTIMLGTTSTTEEELAVDVSIYPNPTSDYITINFHNYLTMDAEVKVYDVSGREVFNSDLDGASTIVNLQHLLSGSYIYKVYDEGREIYNGQLVIL